MVVNASEDDKYEENMSDEEEISAADKVILGCVEIGKQISDALTDDIRHLHFNNTDVKYLPDLNKYQSFGRHSPKWETVSRSMNKVYLANCISLDCSSTAR